MTGKKKTSRKTKVTSKPKGVPRKYDRAKKQAEEIELKEDGF